jgi:alkanesulfonate monooxygenase SsuD/methylene tetrahydromethanopterin reductase-like flavin-dependent oxidoreductase (luciferase family)
MPIPQSERPEHWGIDGLALGISLGGPAHRDDWERMLRWAELADRLGLHSVWVPEMHFAPGVTPSPLLNLAAFAARTKRVRLATTSVLLPIHHPLRIAREVAALDHLSGGRVILGLGRGFRPQLFSAFGIDPASKRDRFDAALDLMLRAWSGQPVSLAGTLFEELGDGGAPVDCTPLQSPHPPLAVAAFGRKGLQQAARHGLPYLASPMEPFELIAENIAFHREVMSEAMAEETAPTGRSASDSSESVIPIMRVVYVSDDQDSINRVLSRLEGQQQQAGARVPKAIARAMDAPLEERVVVGSLAEVTDRLARYREALGMNLLVVQAQLGGVSEGEGEESLHRLIEEVAPAIA